MKAATITVNASKERVEAALEGSAGQLRASLPDAPDARGIEIHASSDRLDQKELKALLRRVRATVEAGEVPTGARRQ
jgi:hypothetical protein